MFSQAFSGILAALDPTALGLMLAGAVVGIVVGILPGINVNGGLALLMPLCFGVDPKTAFALLMGFYCSGSAGGLVTAILLNIPGETNSSATLLDGFPMAQKGEGARAIGIGLTASALGGLFGVMVLTLSMPVIRPFVMAFASPECFIMVLTGITFISVLAGRSPMKGFIAGGLGLMLSFVGSQGVTGFERLTFGSLYLSNGLGVLPLVLGLFAVPEAVDLIATGTTIAKQSIAKTRMSDMLEGVKDVFRHFRLFLRSCLIGTMVGIVPGTGSAVAVFLAYGAAKASSKHPEEFGTGCVEGVLAPESADNASIGGTLVPTLAFGIPGSSGTALLLGAFLIVGIPAGPLMLRDHLDFVFFIIAMAAISQVIASVIVLFAAAQTAKIAFVRGTIIGPLVLVLVAMGAYAQNSDMADVFATFVVGVLGCVLRHFRYPLPAFLIGYILGKMAETYFYLSLTAYGWMFPLRPMTLTLIILALLGLNYNRVSTLFGRKERKT